MKIRPFPILIIIIGILLLVGTFYQPAFLTPTDEITASLFRVSWKGILGLILIIISIAAMIKTPRIRRKR